MLRGYRPECLRTNELLWFYLIYGIQVLGSGLFSESGKRLLIQLGYYRFSIGYFHRFFSGWYVKNIPHLQRPGILPGLLYASGRYLSAVHQNLYPLKTRQYPTDQSPAGTSIRPLLPVHLHDGKFLYQCAQNRSGFPRQEHKEYLLAAGGALPQKPCGAEYC